MKPQIQIALDVFTLDEALSICHRIGDAVDIIECGTLLCAACGVSPAAEIRKRFLDKILVVDLKITDAAEKLCRLAFEHGANWTTINASADLSTVRAGADVAKDFGGEIQMELFGTYGEDQVKAWKQMGIHQVIYHKPRESKDGWHNSDLSHIAWLNGQGMEVSVTGGIDCDTMGLFKGLMIKTFIVGRALLNADDPVAEVDKFKQIIDNHWSV